MKKTHHCIFFLCLQFLFSSAQPGSLDLSFDPGTGANNDVRATVIQPDGKIVVAGWFTDFNNTALNHLARLHSNGSVDTGFHIGSGADAQVYAMVRQSDGKLVVGGEFTHYNGTAINRLARINTDGSLDTSFHIGIGPDGLVRALAMQTDNKIMVGGDFMNYNGTTRQRIARVNTDGSVDNSFNSVNGFNGGVEVLRVQADGKIIAGGAFTIYGGINGCLRFGRLNSNGTFDNTFNPGLGGTSSTVYGLSVQPDTKILLGGDFINYNASPMSHVARVQSNGAVDPGFYIGSGPNDGVNAIALENNGKILIGGAFTSYDGVPLNRIIRLNADGHLDTANFKIGTGVPDRVYSISLQPDEKIILTGSFTDYNGTSRRRIARLYGCTTTQPSPISGRDSTDCAGEIITYSISPVAEATKYEWTIPAGWSGSSDSTTITVTTNGTGGHISVRAFNDSCGYSAAQTKTIRLIQPPGVSVCLVTVDTASTHNILIWEKPLTTLIDSFYIYRETSTNVYTKIAAVHYDSLSEYHDYAANPNATSYRYKLSVLSNCGVESAPSLFHNTIHLQNLGSGNFQWTFYQIENSLNPVLSFNIYRDNQANGNFFPIGNVPGTNATFSDVTFSSFPNADYVIDANWSISCSPSRGVNTTRSNIRHGFIIDTTSGIREQLLEQIEIFPNPATDLLQLKLPAPAHVEHARIFNSFGQLMLTETHHNKDMETMNIESLPPGFYMLNLETNVGRVVRKLIIQ